MRTRTSAVIKRTMFNLERIHQHGVPPVKIKTSNGCISFKCHSDEYDCPNGTYVVDMGHGDSVKLCDECFQRFQDGPTD